MYIRAATTFAVLFLTALTLYHFYSPSQDSSRINSEKYLQRSHSEKAIDDVIKKLWSGDDRDRVIAKNRLIELGTISITPLLALLRDLSENNEPRFVIGKEKEGAELLKYFQGDGKGITPQIAKKFSEIEITSRLQGDAIELLCRLKAEAAIPLIIELLKDREPIYRKKTQEKNALSCFGSLAVPKLIEAIEEVRMSSAFIAYQKNQQNNFVEGLYLLRLLIVMQDIGDSRALGTLEKLLSETSDKHMRAFTWQTIRKIKTRKPHKRE